MWRWIVGVLSMSAGWGTALAGPLEDAQAAHSSGHHAATLRILRAHADVDAYGTQSLLGELFPPCRDGAHAYPEVVALFRRDADRGNPRAQFNLGNAYFFGNGVPKDHVEAVKWFRLAADQDEAGAQQNLAFMYQTGKGVPQDNVQAYLWNILAISRHASTAGEDGSFDGRAAARSLEAVSANMTPAEIALAQALAHAWVPATERRMARTLD